METAVEIAATFSIVAATLISVLGFIVISILGKVEEIKQELMEIKRR